MGVEIYNGQRSGIVKVNMLLYDLVNVWGSQTLMSMNTESVGILLL